MAADVIQATKHSVITASSGYLNPAPSGLFINTDGTVGVVMPDSNGNEVLVTYNVTAGSILPIRPLKITAATAVVIGLY